MAAAIERRSGDPAQVGGIGLPTANRAEAIRLGVRLGHLGLELAHAALRPLQASLAQRGLGESLREPVDLGREVVAIPFDRPQLGRQTRKIISRALELECTRLGLGPRAARAHELALHRLELGLETLDQAIAHHGGLGPHRIGVDAKRLLARGLGRLPPALRRDGQAQGTDASERRAVCVAVEANRLPLQEVSPADRAASGIGSGAHWQGDGTRYSMLVG